MNESKEIQLSDLTDEQLRAKLLHVTVEEYAYQQVKCILINELLRRKELGLDGSSVCGKLTP